MAHLTTNPHLPQRARRRHYDADFFGTLKLHAVTRRQLPSGGEVVYVGTAIDASALEPLATETLSRQGLGEGPHGVATAPSQPVDVEVVRRRDAAGQPWVARINYAPTAQRVTTGGGKVVELPAYGVSVLPD